MTFSLYKKLNMASSMLFISILNINCGGGGSSGSGAVITQPNEPIQASNPTPQPTVLPASTSELITDQNFLFNASSILSVDVNLNSLEYIRSYINICYGNESLQIDYDNCVFNAPFKHGVLSTTIELANDVESLYLAIWKYGLNDEPVTSEWYRENGMTWTVAE